MKKLLSVAISVLMFAIPSVAHSAPVSNSSKSNSSSSHYQYRFVGDQLQRKGNLEKQWTAKSQRSLQKNSIRAKMFNGLKSVRTGGQGVLVNYIVGSNVPRSMLVAYKKQINQAAMFYDFSGLELPLDILIYTEKDTSTMTDYWEPRWHGDGHIARKTQSLSFYNGKNSIGRSVGGSADVRQLRDGSYPTIGIDFYMGSSHTQTRHLLVEHVAHEMAHAWQWHAMGVPEKIVAGQRFDASSLLPCHALEGAANTLGITASVSHGDWYVDASNMIIRRVARDSGISRMTESLAIELLNKSESWSSCDEGYAIGMLAYEWFISEYGADKFFSLYYKVGESKTFDQVLREVAGISKGEFYKRSAPHIAKTFNAAMLDK